MTGRRVLVMTLTLALASRVLPDDSTMEALIKRTAPSVVTIIAYNPDKAMPGIGTGFFTAPDTVVSVRHVFAGVNRAEVHTAGGEVIRVAGLVAEDREGDIAILKLVRPLKGVRPLELTGKLPAQGQKIFTVSSPFGLERTVSKGIVSCLRRLPDVGTAVQHTAPVSAGSSGCPLISLSGKVLAVQTATITTGDGIVPAGQVLNFASPARRVTALEPGKTRSLAECAREVPSGWTPAITRKIDVAGFRPFTRDDFEGALPLFEQSVRQEPGEPDAWFRLGLCREKLGKVDDAINAYRKAVELKDDFAVALNNLGVVYIRKGRHADAAKTLRSAVKARPDYTEALTSLSRAYLHLKQYPEALDAALRAVRNDPTHAEARFNLGEAHARSGNMEKAREQYETLLRLDRSRAKKLEALLEIRWSRLLPEATRHAAV